jgi:hypothetical protein
LLLLQLIQEGEPDSAAAVAAAVARRGGLTAFLRVCECLVHSGQVLPLVTLAVALVRYSHSVRQMNIT